MSVLETRIGGLEGDGSAARLLPRDGVAAIGVSAVEPSVSAYENKLHELRASLAGVAGAVHALEGDALPFGTERRRRIERMLRSEVARLQRLLAPTDGRLPAPSEELDLDEVLESVVLARGMAGHEVSWRRTGQRVRARRDEVVEILNILLTNAARHASGSPTQIDVRQEEDDVRIIVSDDGPGVPEELRPAIFERGTKGPTGGDGIGLSVAKVLAGELGGSLDLNEDERDRGAAFEMKLPWGVAEGLR
jgi:signal transduction histidine kinase